jgi:hypothetical protein
VVNDNPFRKHTFVINSFKELKMDKIKFRNQLDDERLGSFLHTSKYWEVGGKERVTSFALTLFHVSLH